MSKTQQIIIAIAGVFAVGFIMVGTNKQQTTEQQESAAMIRALSGMQNMAHNKCPKLIKKHTGTQISSLVSNSETDKVSYLTLEWIGGEGENFKTVSCTLTTSRGGVSKLVIDGKIIFDKD